MSPGSTTSSRADSRITAGRYRHRCMRGRSTLRAGLPLSAQVRWSRNSSDSATARTTSAPAGHLPNARRAVRHRPAQGTTIAKRSRVDAHPRRRRVARHRLGSGRRRRTMPVVPLEPLLIGSLQPVRGEDRIIVPPDEIPPLLPAALKVIEDRNFETHAGIDLKAILRAAWVNLRAGHVEQGGSTLTQQLVKSYFLGEPRTFWRKAREAIMAMLLELRYSKAELMGGYINEIYLGQDGDRAIHGFGLASRFYFGKPLEELELDEVPCWSASSAALLITIRARNRSAPRARREFRAGKAGGAGSRHGQGRGGCRQATARRSRREFRERITPPISIWCGASSARLRRRGPEGARPARLHEPRSARAGGRGACGQGQDARGSMRSDKIEEARSRRHSSSRCQHSGEVVAMVGGQQWQAGRVQPRARREAPDRLAGEAGRLPRGARNRPVSRGDDPE